MTMTMTGKTRYIAPVVYCYSTLQICAGIYRVFTGKSECGDFKFTGFAYILAIPAKTIRNFEKKNELRIYIKSPHKVFTSKLAGIAGIHSVYMQFP